MTVKNVINRIQEINRSISDMVAAPPLDEYPSSIETMILPIALTDPERGTFEGVNGDNQSDDEYVIRVLLDSIGAVDLGAKKEFGVDIFDAYRTKYLDPATYTLTDSDGTVSPAIQPVLLSNPYRATIQMPFRAEGPTIIEYPVGTDRWWHGFEIRFAVKEVWEWECD